MSAAKAPTMKNGGQGGAVREERQKLCDIGTGRSDIPEVSRERFVTQGAKCNG